MELLPVVPNFDRFRPMSARQLPVSVLKWIFVVHANTPAWRRTAHWKRWELKSSYIPRVALYDDIMTTAPLSVRFQRVTEHTVRYPVGRSPGVGCRHLPFIGCPGPVCHSTSDSLHSLSPISFVGRGAAGFDGRCMILSPPHGKVYPRYRRSNRSIHFTLSPALSRHCPSLHLSIALLVSIFPLVALSPVSSFFSSIDVFPLFSYSLPLWFVSAMSSPSLTIHANGVTTFATKIRLLYIDNAVIVVWIRRILWNWLDLGISVNRRILSHDTTMPWTIYSV